MRRILAIAVALVMAMALSVSVFAEYTMTATTGQDFDGKVLADGVELTGNWYNDKLATNWMNQGEWDLIIAALNEENAVLVITYSGEINAVGFQSSVAEVKFTDFAVADGSLTIDAAAFMAASAEALNGFDWCNLMVEAAAGTVITGFTVTTGAAGGPVEDGTGNDNNTVDPVDGNNGDTTSAPDTGLALAVVPAIVAMAAVAVSKKH